jgi:hypothetical protein
MDLAKEAEKLMTRFPNAQVNVDEQRQLRANQPLRHDVSVQFVGVMLALATLMPQREGERVREIVRGGESEFGVWLCHGARIAQG